VIKISGYILSVILIIGLAGCQDEKNGTRYYNGCNDINYNKDSNDARFIKKMLNDNLKVQKETLIGLGFILNNNISYKDVCVKIVAFEDRDDSFSRINKIGFNLILMRNNISYNDYKNKLNKQISKKEN
jgi:hypothetical protein